MKILLPDTVGGAFGHITDSWENCLKSAGFQTRRYTNVEQWLEFDPDLYIGCSGHKRAIPKSRTKLAIHANPYGSSSVPGIDEGRESIEWIKSQNPDCVFGYGLDKDRQYWDKYESDLGIKWVPMATAGDATKYSVVNSEREYDIGYLGGRWAYKALTIDEYLIPVLRSPFLKCNIKGWGDWPSDLNVTPLNKGDENAFFNSVNIGPCMSEKHTYEYEIDLPERVYKCALAGVLPIHDAPKAVRSIFEYVVAASTPKEYFDKCTYFAANTNRARASAKLIRDEVLAAHTYHHRLSRLLEDIGFIEESNHLLSDLTRYSS
jgi:hypothetical protein